ncbi:MAG TPA: arginase family protein, partial [Longimicrobium sp.]|nr:arginase family protein [Longimicrobium sp.]
GHAVQTQWIEAPAGPRDPEIRTTFHFAAGVADAVRDARSSGALPIILSGNCSTSIGTLAGLADAEPVVVWLDAHGDFNTPETSPSGFLDGMSLAAATGHCWADLASAIPGFHPTPESRVLLVGTRDLDPAEADLLRASACTVLSPHELDAGLSDALDTLRTRAGTVYLHIDLDVLDPSIAPANLFAAPDGLQLPQVIGIVRGLRRRFDLAAVALTAYDPYYDPDARIPAAAESILTELVNDA